MSAPLQNVGLKDVALRAGCSIGVASTVLNGAAGNIVVGAKTRLRVQQAAKEMGYRPNFAARSLVRRSTRTLGIYILPNSPSTSPGNAYEGQIINGIETVCDAHDYDLLLINLGGHKTPDKCLHQIAERRADGLILIRVDGSPDWLKDLRQMCSRIVLVDSVDPDPGIRAVSFDNLAAMRLAVRHLAGLGHRRIGFLGTCLKPPEMSSVVRQQAFVQIIREMGLAWSSTWVHDSSVMQSASFDPAAFHCQQEACLGARYIMALPGPRPTALVAYNDLVAASACKELRKFGVRVPEQMSIVGLGNVPVSEYCEPALTTLSQPMFEMGRRAAELLIDEPADAAAQPSGRCSTHTPHELFAPRLVLRQSTAPPPAESES
ncbi:MAG: LacI family DNA-binding transcriptional regulator [Phycisphaerales bacterium]